MFLYPFYRKEKDTYNFKTIKQVSKETRDKCVDKHQIYLLCFDVCKDYF